MSLPLLFPRGVGNRDRRAPAALPLIDEGPFQKASFVKSALSDEAVSLINRLFPTYQSMIYNEILCKWIVKHQMFLKFPEVFNRFSLYEAIFIDQSADILDPEFHVDGPLGDGSFNEIIMIYFLNPARVRRTKYVSMPDFNDERRDYSDRKVIADVNYACINQSQVSDVKENEVDQGSATFHSSLTCHASPHLDEDEQNLRRIVAFKWKPKKTTMKVEESLASFSEALESPNKGDPDQEGGIFDKCPLFCFDWGQLLYRVGGDWVEPFFDESLTINEDINEVTVDYPRLLKSQHPKSQHMVTWIQTNVLYGTENRLRIFISEDPDGESMKLRVKEFTKETQYRYERADNGYLRVEAYRIGYAIPGQWVPWVFTGESTIEGAGTGLFANRAFEKGEVVGEYCGRELSEAEADDLTFDLSRSPHHVTEVEGKAIDGYGCVQPEYIFGEQYEEGHPGALIPLINSVKNAWDPKRNVGYTKSLSKSYTRECVAIKRIEKGQELLDFYGAQYWKNHAKKEKLRRRVRLMIPPQGEEEAMNIRLPYVPEGETESFTHVFRLTKDNFSTPGHLVEKGDVDIWDQIYDGSAVYPYKNGEHGYIMAFGNFFEHEMAKWVSICVLSKNLRIEFIQDKVGKFPGLLF